MGEYTLSSGGNVIVTGGMFGGSESTSFCVDEAAGMGTFNGVLPVDSTVEEVVNCEKSSYIYGGRCRNCNIPYSFLGR